MSDYDSDNLDSGKSRKRRRISSSPVELCTNAISAPPSRIKRKQPTSANAPGAAAAAAAVPAAQKPQKTVDNDDGQDGGEPGGQIEAAETHEPDVDSPTTFEALGVKPWLVRSLNNMAIRVPTAVQTGCIPEILKGRDCIGGSRTGSGKTVAFAVPILQKLAQDPAVIFSLILTPTRELALQIFEQFKAIGSRQTLKIILIIGGFDMREQAIALSQRPHIVIATPGRLADHIRSSGEDTVCGLKRVRFLVLDEADRLLADTGRGSMLQDLDDCMSALPPSSDRQTLLFTATMTPEVMELRSQPTRPGKLPVHVCEVGSDGEDRGKAIAVPPTLQQTYLRTPTTHKEHYLHELLQTKQNEPKSVIVFVNRTKTADVLNRALRMLGHRVAALHSSLPQRERVDNLGRFRASAARILVATDVASRGLDIPDVGMVINYDIPLDPDDYIHRVGRTARAGKKGESITFFGHERDADKILAIEARVGSKMVEWEEEGVNIETRVKRDSLRLVSEKKREALLDAEEGRDVKGNRKRGKKKLRAS